MQTLYVIAYVAASIFPLAAGIGMHQYLFGIDDHTRGFGGILFLVIGGICAVGYVLIMAKMRRAFQQRSEDGFAWQQMTAEERTVAVGWPLAFAVGYGVMTLATWRLLH